MLSWLLHRKLDAEEKKLGESMEYLRYIVNVSPATFLRFASIMPFAHSRKVLPTNAWYVAQLVAVGHEDCGPCLQITVNLAQKDGVDGSVIRAVLDGERDSLSEEMQAIYDFTRSLASGGPNVDSLREELRTRYGDRGLIELSYAIAAGRIPPTVKRVLGYGIRCKDVTINTNAAQDEEDVA